MSPPSVTAYFPVPDLCAHRAYLGAFYPVCRSGSDIAAADLSEIRGVVAEAGVYRSGDIHFDLTEPGVYRFQWKGRPGQQVAVLPDTPSGVASVAAEIGTLGNLDRNKTWGEQAVIAKRRRLSMHCVQFSELSVRFAHMAGLSGVVWLMWNYEALERGDFLSSHAISEIRSKDGGEVRLFDLSFGVEFTVNEGRTDFSAFQTVLMDGGTVDAKRITEAFGFEYGSKFFNAYADDFELDALAGDKGALLEAHARLVRGSYVIGKDVQSRSYATARSKAIAAAADDIDDTKRAEMNGAQTVGTASATPAALTGQSRFRMSENLIGYRLSGGSLSPLTAGDTGGDVLETDHLRKSGLFLTGGGTVSIGGDALDLSAPGLHRFIARSAGRPMQALTVARDPSLVAASLLEAVCAGGLHDAMSPSDLRLAAQTGKVIAQSRSVGEMIADIFGTAKVGLRIWTVPTVLSDDSDWPVAGDLHFLEIGGSDRNIHLFELGRRMRVTVGGGPCTFEALEGAVLSQSGFEISSLCVTPGLAYGTTSAAAGLFMDVLTPLWYGAEEFAHGLIRDSLSTFPGLGVDHTGRQITTEGSKEKAALCLSRSLGERGRMVSVLDCKAIGKKEE